MTESRVSRKTMPIQALPEPPQTSREPFHRKRATDPLLTPCTHLPSSVGRARTELDVLATASHVRHEPLWPTPTNRPNSRRPRAFAILLILEQRFPLALRCEWDGDKPRPRRRAPTRLE
jgi:hypothetical protein